MSGPSSVVAVVTTYDSTESVRRCVDSLSRAGGLDHIVVVDNGSATDAIDPAPAVEVLRPTSNRGFGAAANAGAMRAIQLGADAVAVLNDDVQVTTGWLAPLLLELQDPHVGAVQPMLVLDGVDPPTVNSLGVRIGVDGAGTDIGFGDLAADVDRSSRDIDVFTGGAVVFTSEFVKAVGGFDERYFLYYEDVDLAHRGRSLGWRYRCVPSSVVTHVKGVSSSALGRRVVYLRERNRLWCAFRNEPPSTIARAMWLSIRRLRHTPRRTHAKALAVGVIGGVSRLVERRRRPS